MNKEGLISRMGLWYENMDWGVDEETGIPFMPDRAHKQTYEQIKEIIELFHSPLGHMTKYNPEEEWIRIK